MFENAYDCRFHSKTLLKYHIIFSTKYRYRCLNPIRDTVFSADCASPFWNLTVLFICSIIVILSYMLKIK